MEESFVIAASKSKILGEQLDKINKLFNVKVEIQADPSISEGNDSQWVHVRSSEKDDKNVSDAKTHIIALCNPECSERASFPGFPVFIFTAFKERCKNRIERDCGVVLSVADDASLNIHGSNIGVTLTISQIHHLRKLQRDLDHNKDREAAIQFDLYVEKIADDCQAELQTLSNSLKKEILNLLDIPIINSSLGAKASKVSATSTNVSTASSENNIPVETILIEDSIIVVTSSSESETESEESDDANDEPSTSSKLASDGSSSRRKGNDLTYMLPPNFAIREWIKVHYQCTGDPKDFVNKSDMLDHFKTHFDLPDHPELANAFFDKLAVRIFPQDPNYRSVQTKKTKCKRSRRRLVCLRRRTVSESEKEELNIPETKPDPNTLEPVTNVSQSAISMPPLSTLMKDWNSNRNGLKNLPNPTNQPRPNETTVPLHTWQPPPMKPVPSNLGSSPKTNLQGWLSSTAQKPRTQPKYGQRQSNNGFSSIASQVSKMDNHNLVHRARPPINPNLRPIVIDGSNVAMSHGNGRNFSCRGIALCARFFMERGHGEITCFVPNYRKGGGGNPPSSDAHILRELEDIGIVKSTPSRRIRGQNVVCYDDRFIIELAGATNGVILSNDQYRDLMSQDRKFVPIVEQQLLQYTIVGDLLMLPEDPLGRKGPSLEDFLSLRRNGSTVPKQRIVKVPSPARPRQNIVQPPATPFPAAQNPFPRVPKPVPAVHHAPVTGATWLNPPLAPPETLSPDQHVLCYEMLKVLPDRENDIRKVITDHPLVTDIQLLMNLLLISDTGS